MEIFGIRILNKLILQGYDINDKDFLYLMMNKTGKYYQRNKDYYHNEGILNNYFKSKNKELKSSTSC